MSDSYGTTIYAGVHVAEPVRNAVGGTLSQPSRELMELLSGGQTSAGVPVNFDTAIGYAPVWACLNKIAGHCGYLPVSVYAKDRTDSRKRVEATTHPAYWLLTEPNEYMTGQTLRETLTWHALLGNGRALIVRNQRTDPAELIPLPPKSTITFLAKFAESDASRGDLSDVVRDGSAEWQKWHGVQVSDGKWLFFEDEDVLHLPGLGYDGIQGYSVVDLAKQSLGLGMASERASAQHFKNGARPSFMLKAPPGVFRKSEDAQKFLDDFNARHAGAENDGRVGMLREGIDLALTQQTPKDADWIAQRKFQREEVALWFAVERLLGVEANTSYKSLEETNRAYVTNCLTRWLAKWEAEMGRKLLSRQQRYSESHYFKFTTAALLRGTTKERYEVYQIGRQIEVFSANDVRSMEDMPPREDGGDDYSNPAINPTPDPAAPDETTEAPVDRVRETVRDMIANRLGELIKVEVARVRQAANKPRKFLAWLDEFYAEGEFGGRVVSTYKACRGLTEDGRDHCDQSRAALLEVAGSANVDQLSVKVEALTEEWHTRAGVAADRLSKEVF